MKELDQGHNYLLDTYDDYEGADPVRLTFMKRMGPKYPFNESAYGGTNCREVIRALIKRTLYLNEQMPCPALIEYLEKRR